MFGFPGDLTSGGTAVEALPGLAALFEAMPDGIVVVDQDGTITRCNPAAEVLFGYGPGGLAGMSVEELIPTDLRSAHADHRSRFAADPYRRPMGSGLRISGVRSDRTTFPIDVSLAPIELGGQRFVGAFVRDVSEASRVELLLLAVSQINRALLAALTPREIYAQIAREARLLLGAELGTVSIPSHRLGHMVIAGADDEDYAYLTGLDMEPGSSAAGYAYETGEIVRIHDLALSDNVHPDGAALGLGPAIVVPIAADGEAIGALSIVRAPGQPDFTELEQTLLEIFSSTVAVAMVADRTRNQLAVSRLVSDQHRIASDLDDVVIATLHKIGARLDRLATLVPGIVRERVETTSEDLRNVIVELEREIEDLTHAPLSTVPVTTRVRDMVDHAAIELGFQPTLHWSGPIDSHISAELRHALLEALGDILHNIACHSMATRVGVDISVDALSLVVSVSDDGVGIPEGPASARWLNRLASRAREHGGELSVVERRPSGCLYEWRVTLED